MKKLLFSSLLFIYSFTLCYAQKIDIVTMDFPPYVYKEDNQLKGFNIEILNEIFKRMNIEVNYQLLPWIRAVKMIENNRADAIFPFLKNKKREEFTIFPEPFTAEPFSMFVLNNSNIQYSGDLNELINYSFGRVRGYSSGNKFDSFIKKNSINIEEVKNSEVNLNKLLKNRFEILVDNRYVILHKLKEENRLNEVRELTPMLTENKAYLGFSKVEKNIKLVKQFNMILEEIKIDGTYNKIINKYFK